MKINNNIFLKILGCALILGTVNCQASNYYEDNDLEEMVPIDDNLIDDLPDSDREDIRWLSVGDRPVLPKKDRINLTPEQKNEQWRRAGKGIFEKIDVVTDKLRDYPYKFENATMQNLADEIYSYTIGHGKNAYYIAEHKIAGYHEYIRIINTNTNDNNKEEAKQLRDACLELITLNTMLIKLNRNYRNK